jgi:outer membrane lipoprotein carrier protein
MSRLHLRYASAIAALALVVALPVIAGDSARDILDHVRKTYEAVKDARLTFTQKTRFAASRLEQSTTGTLVVKKEHHYRIETEEQTVVTDGATVWSYARASNQVLIDHYRGTDKGFSPERLLAGETGNLTASVVGSERLGKQETTILKMTPRNDRSSITSLRLWIDNAGWVVRKAEITDVSGKVTTYTIGDLQFNSGVPDSVFTLSTPDGADVVDLR